jgi:hypothetical protein
VADRTGGCSDPAAPARRPVAPACRQGSTSSPKCASRSACRY